MEENLIKKKLVILKQESKKVQTDWALIHQYLVDLNLSGKDEKKETSNLETREHQVGASSSVRLILSNTICPLHHSLLPPTTFLIHAPKQPPISWNVVIYCSVYAQVFWEVSILWDTELLASIPCCSAWSCSPVRVADEKHVIFLHVLMIDGMLCRAWESSRSCDRSHAGDMWPPMWNVPCRDKSQNQISKVLLIVLELGGMCPPPFVLQTNKVSSHCPMLDLYWYRSEWQLVSLCICVVGYFALPIVIGAMVSVKRSMLTVHYVLGSRR